MRAFFYRLPPTPEQVGPPGVRFKECLASGSSWRLRTGRPLRPHRVSVCSKSQGVGSLLQRAQEQAPFLRLEQAVHLMSRVPESC